MIPSSTGPAARTAPLLAVLVASLLVLGLLAPVPAHAAVTTADRAGSSTSSETAAGERDRKKSEKDRKRAEKAAAKAEKRDQKAAEKAQKSEQKAADREEKAAERGDERAEKDAEKAEKREQKAAEREQKAAEREQKAAEREQKAAAKAAEREEKAAAKAAAREEKAAEKAAERETETATEDDTAGAAGDSPTASPSAEPANDAAGSAAAATGPDAQRRSLVLAARPAGCVDGLAVLQGDCSLNSSLGTNAGPQPQAQPQAPAAAPRKPAAAPSQPLQPQGWSRVTAGVTDLASALPQTGAAAWLTYGGAAGVLLLVGGFVLMRRTRSGD